MRTTRPKYGFGTMYHSNIFSKWCFQKSQNNRACKISFRFNFSGIFLFWRGYHLLRAAANTFSLLSVRIKIFLPIVSVRKDKWIASDKEATKEVSPTQKKQKKSVFLFPYTGVSCKREVVRLVSSCIEVRSLAAEDSCSIVACTTSSTYIWRLF